MKHRKHHGKIAEGGRERNAGQTSLAAATRHAANAGQKDPASAAQGDSVGDCAKPRKEVDWAWLQCWLQEAGLVLNYCTRLVCAMRTGNINEALDDILFKMQFFAGDQELSEPLIRKYVSNIGKLAEAGWKTNDDFPIFRPETDWNCGG